MPCYEVNLMSVEFNPKNVIRLLKALNKKNYKYDYQDYQNNILKITYGPVINLNTKTITGSIDGINFIKRLYAEETIRDIAKKKHWLLKGEGSKLELKRY